MRMRRNISGWCRTVSGALAARAGTIPDERIAPTRRAVMLEDVVSMGLADRG